MARTFTLVSAVLFVVLAPVFAGAAILTTTLGDADGLGWGLTPGDTYLTFPFDNRTASDPLFTDWGTYGETDAGFTFNYSAILGTINSASLEFGLAGLEDAHHDSSDPNDWDDRLFLDGVEVPGAFDGDYTGIETYGIVNLSVPGGMLYLLTDGTADFFFDAWQYGTSPTMRPGDQVSFDYVTLTVDYSQAPAVPAPGALVLAALGAGLLVSRAVRRRTF